ncbi:MAG: hypothetical protein FWG02_01680 [Holophagaceae bacterium]|nr:hypothetical protein [Holophagaceae bacterium]
MRLQQLLQPKMATHPKASDGLAVFRIRVQLLFQSPLTTDYRIALGQNIEDSEGLKVTPDTIDFSTADYQTESYIPSGIADQLSEITTIGTNLYIRAGTEDTDIHQVHHWTYNTNQWTPQGIISPDGLGHFYGQRITKLKAFESALPGIGTDGRPAMLPVLLVATTPMIIDPNESHQGALWAFSICKDIPRLLFAVSLGPGVYSYVSDIDCRNGIIAVSRITSSTALIDINTAIQGWINWADDPSQAIRPEGANQQAIFQTYHIGDPNATFIPSYYGINLLPIQSPENGMAIALSQGVAHAYIGGITNMILKSNNPNTWYPQPTFIQSQTNPMMDNRVAHLPLESGLWLRRQNLIEGITITETDSIGNQITYTTNVTVGHRNTAQGDSARYLQLVDQGDPENPRELGKWIAPGQILNPDPCVDSSTGLVAVPVAKTGTANSTTWFIIDIRNTSNPGVIAEIPNLGRWGSMSCGILYTSGYGKLASVDLNQIVVPQIQQQDVVSNQSSALNPVSGFEAKTRIASIVKNSNQNNQANLFDCAPAPNYKITIDLVTINQGVERYLDDDLKNISPEFKEKLLQRPDYIGKETQLYKDFEWKKDVPRVGGRPAIFRVYASKKAGEDIPPVKISLEVTNSKTYSEGGSPELKTAIFLAKENSGEAVALSENKGKFGDIVPENPNGFTVFTFELTNKEDFILLGEETKIKVIVEPQSENGNTDQSITVGNPYQNPKTVRFEYSEEMVIDLIPVEYITITDETIKMEDAQIEEFKQRFSENLRAIMPITLCDDKGEERLKINVLKSPYKKNENDEDVVDNSKLIASHSGKEFDKLTWKEKWGPLEGTNLVVPTRDKLSEKFDTWEGKLITNADAPYNDVEDSNNSNIFKLLLINGSAEFGIYYPEKHNGVDDAPRGYIASPRMAVIYVYPTPNQKKFHYFNSIHEIGHNLGSLHAPSGIVDVASFWMNQPTNSPYTPENIGVPGYLFRINSSPTIKPWWKPDDRIGNLMPDEETDIMGYGILLDDSGNRSYDNKWVSDFNFAQWWNSQSNQEYRHLPIGKRIYPNQKLNPKNTQ